MPGAPRNSHMRMRDRVVRTVKEIFSCHGAVPMASMQLGLAHAGLPSDTVRVLAPSGVQLALRWGSGASRWLPDGIRVMSLALYGAWFRGSSSPSWCLGLP